MSSTENINLLKEKTVNEVVFRHRKSLKHKNR